MASHLCAVWHYFSWVVRDSCVYSQLWNAVHTGSRA